MTALSEFRNKAIEKNKPFPIEFEDGSSVNLKSILLLDKEELKLFNASLKRLQKEDEDETDVEQVRAEFVSTLAGVADDKKLAAKMLDKESVGTLTAVFEEYASALSEGTKSEATA